MELKEKQLDLQRDTGSSRTGMNFGQAYFMNDGPQIDTRILDMATKILPLMTDENITSFFVILERTATIQGWNKQIWPAIVNTRLRGKALEILAELPTQDANDYDSLKEALLNGFKVTHFTYQHAFRNAVKEPNENYTQFAFRLETTQRAWLKALNVIDDAEKLRQTFLKEQFISKLPHNLALYVADHPVETLAELSKLLDNYIALKETMSGNKGDRGNAGFLPKSVNLAYYPNSVQSTVKQTTDFAKPSNFAMKFRHVSGDRSSDTQHKFPKKFNGYHSNKFNAGNKYSNFKRNSYISSPRYHRSETREDGYYKNKNNSLSNKGCWICGFKSHIAKDCFRRHSKTGSTGNAAVRAVCFVENNDQHKTERINDNFEGLYTDTVKCNNENMAIGNTVHENFHPYCLKGRLSSEGKEDSPVLILRDTGSLISLLNPDKISSDYWKSTKEITLIKGVGSNQIEIPLVLITLTIGNVQSMVKVGLISDLPQGVNLLLGNDIINNFVELVEDINCNVVTRSMAQQQQQQQQQSLTSDETTSDLGLQDLFAQQPDKATDKASPTTRTNTEDATVIQTSDNQTTSTGQSMIDMTDQSWQVLHIDRAKLITLQQADTKLQKLTALAISRPFPNKKDFYFMENDMLMHRKFLPKQQKSYNRIVIPKVLVNQILKLSHDAPSSGHLGRRKTIDRLVPNFFWPKFYKSVRNYVTSCDTCQKLAKMGQPIRAKLQPLPLVSEPFKRLVLDVVGPLPPCPKSGNRFLITFIDTASHFPIAVPTVDHTATTICNVLTQVFSNYGLPYEIQTDNGSEMISEITEHFLKECGIKHIKSSPMHPQSNAILERWHRVLKQMLKACNDNFDENWDLSLNWVLFAYREVPVETLGFSPFELIYNFPIRGPLTLLKEGWIKEELVTVKPNVAAYIQTARDNVNMARAIAMETTKGERTRSKTWYDKKARDREFNVGDRVLIFYPDSKHPMEFKWKGPFTIQKKSGNLNYWIKTNSKRKPLKLFHVNMLKEYVERKSQSVNLITKEEQEEEVELKTEELSNSEIKGNQNINEEEYSNTGPSLKETTGQFDLGHLRTSTDGATVHSPKPVSKHL